MKNTSAIMKSDSRPGRARSPLRAAARTECSPYHPVFALCLLLAALCLLAPPARAATNDLTAAIQRGLFEEEANQNLGAAIQAYQTVASQFDKDRKLAATAIFRLGECYRKQGNTNDAATQYERILREFSDQPTLVTLSRQTLAALGSTPPASAAPVLSDAARQEQKRLMEEEIKLVEKQVEAQRRLVQAGGAPWDSVVPTERELLKLKRQLAALDAGQPLSIAATEGSPTSTEADEVRRIQALIKDSPDLINAPDHKGETLLQLAAAKGNLAVVKLLLDSGAAVDGLQQPGLTALHFAAGNGHKTIVDLLLSKGAKLGAQTGGGVTALHLAARKGYESVVKALLAAGAPVNAKTTDAETRDRPDTALPYRLYPPGQTPLHLAAAAGYAGLAEVLLAKGAEVNAVDDSGRTALSYALEKRSLPILQVLLAAKADPNTGASNLPLHVAACYGDLPALKLLLANGADPNRNANVTGVVSGIYGLPSGGGNATPLAVAVSRQRAEVVAELIRAKADPNGFLPGGQSRLIFGTLYNTPTLKALLEGGADPNLHGREDKSPLLCAVEIEGRQPGVELLLAHKADVNVGNPRTGWTPLHEAAGRGWKDIAELLLKAGADVNAKDKNGFTPLYVAVSRDQRELVDLLLAHKADPNLRDIGGHTPLDYAKSKAQQRQPQPPGNGGRPGMVGGYPGLGTSVPAAAREQEPKPETLADLLRRHGALDDLPHLDQIGARRSAIGFSEAPFTKGAQDWNQFTLLELIAVQYELLTASLSVGGGAGYSASELFGRSRLPFPDLAHVHISRPTANLKGWEDQVVDLTPLVASGDCAKDVRLRWGDVVEIPEADHPLYERWAGFSNTELTNLQKCLTRQVEIVVKGLATPITLAPIISYGRLQPPPPPGQPRLLTATSISTGTPFWLLPVLLQSKLVLVSSDLAHVKVTRRDPATGQTREWVVDCSDAKTGPDFWLRDGDRIEVPEKAYGSAGSGASGVPSAPGQAGVAAPEDGRAPIRQIPQSDLRLPADQVNPAISQRLAKIIPRMPQPQRAQAAEGWYLDVGNLRYSPEPNDVELLNAGYHKDQSAKTRQAELWQRRAASDLSGRAANAVWTGTDMVVFGGEGMGTSFADGARYCLAEDTWAMLPSQDAPSSRTGHAMVWTGKEVIVWGGFGGLWGRNTNHNDGARYNPRTDAWKPVTTKNAPEARFDFSALWNGREMLVWGGYTDNRSRYQGAHADAYLNTGGRYDPSSDAWKTIPTEGAPSRRAWNTLLWTGKEMLIWGGANATKVLNDGGRYNPAKGLWRPISMDGAPGPRGSHVSVWTGKEMIVWGGSAREPGALGDYFENGARYNPDTDTWKPISTIGAPKGRVLATAVWTGTEMVLWGGVNDAQVGQTGNGNRFVGTGARYNPATDTWTDITTAGAPSPRLTSVVWTGDGLLSFGGYNGRHLSETWLYSPQRTLYPYAKQ